MLFVRSTPAAKWSSRSWRRTARGKGGESTSTAASTTTPARGCFGCGTTHAWVAGKQGRAPDLLSRTGDIILYATSEDGIQWTKPSLGRHEFDGSRANNILLFDKHSPTVTVDADAPPDQRFKLACWNWAEGRDGYWIAHSADGLSWREYDGNPVLVGDDEILESVSVARHPHTAEYFAFHRRWGAVRGHVRRLVAVATSRDFTVWDSHGVCLTPDEQDDAWVQDEGQRTEFYGMAGFAYGGQFLAFLPVFDVIKDARGEPGMPASVAADGSTGLHAPAAISESGKEIDQAPWDGPIAVQLAHSRDGLTWQRFEDRSPIIARGEPGSFDAGCILCSADRPVVHGDEVWHYYTRRQYDARRSDAAQNDSRSEEQRGGWTASFRWMPVIWAGVIETVALQAEGGAACRQRGCRRRTPGGRGDDRRGRAAGGLHARGVPGDSGPTACARRWSGMGVRACLPASRCACDFTCGRPVSTASASTGRMQHEWDMVFR